MITALVSKQFVAGFGDALKSVARRSGKEVQFITLPEERGARLTQADCDRIDCAFIDRDIRFDEQVYGAFSDAMVSKSVPAQAANAEPRHISQMAPSADPQYVHRKVLRTVTDGRRYRE